MANENDTSIEGLGAGKMEWLSPLALLDKAGATVFSVNSAGAVTLSTGAVITATGDTVVFTRGAKSYTITLV